MTIEHEQTIGSDAATEEQLIDFADRAENDPVSTLPALLVEIQDAVRRWTFDSSDRGDLLVVYARIALRTDDAAQWNALYRRVLAYYDEVDREQTAGAITGILRVFGPKSPHVRRLLAETEAFDSWTRERVIRSATAQHPDVALQAAETLYGAPFVRLDTTMRSLRATTDARHIYLADGALNSIIWMWESCRLDDRADVLVCNLRGMPTRDLVGLANLMLREAGHPGTVKKEKSAQKMQRLERKIGAAPPSVLVLTDVHRLRHDGTKADAVLWLVQFLSKICPRTHLLVTGDTTACRNVFAAAPKLADQVEDYPV